MTFLTAQQRMKNNRICPQHLARQERRQLKAYLQNVDNEYEEQNTPCLLRNYVFCVGLRNNVLLRQLLNWDVIQRSCIPTSALLLSSKTSEIYTHVSTKSIQQIKSPFDDL